MFNASALHFEDPERWHQDAPTLPSLMFQGVNKDGGGGGGGGAREKRPKKWGVGETFK